MIKQKGLALVLVLWILSLLMIMAGSFALSMRREASIVAGIKNNAQAMAIAESGIAMAELMLLGTDPAKGWRADGNIYEIDSLDAKIRVRLLSETGKIDINKADEALLLGLMKSAPADTDKQTKLVNAILDWRDADDLVHLEGAEKQEYVDAGLKYQPRNKPFQSIEELQLVLGMNEAVFKWIEPLVTVYSGRPQVNFQQAAKEVLQVIPGLDSRLIDSYIASRMDSAKNNLPVPPFPSSSGLNNLAGQGSLAGQTGLSGQNNPTGQNNALTIDSEALLADGSRALISAVVKKSGNNQATPFEVLRWQSVTANSASLFTGAMSELLVKQYAEPELNN